MPIVRVKRVYIKILSIEECRYQTVFGSVKLVMNVHDHLHNFLTLSSTV
jgi:hypothetical protein